MSLSGCSLRDRDVAERFAELLVEIFETIGDGTGEDLVGQKSADFLSQIRSVGTFDACGVLAGGNGFVVSFVDGSEFQVSVVRSRL